MLGSQSGVLDGTAGVITGAAGGLGSAMVRSLVAEGASVFGVDQDDASLRRLGASLADSEGRWDFGVADVAVFSEMEDVFQQCAQSWGGVDYVIANAGIVYGGSFAEGDPALYRRIVETNLTGVVMTVRAALPHLLRSAQGHVILIASVSGRVTYPGEAVYVATKWGVVGFGGALRKELAATDVRVTLVEPGVIDTPLARSTEFGRQVIETIPPLAPEDVAEAVMFAITRRRHVAVDEVVIRPQRQEI
jgi:NADP-dependent 3-hydroxy acid dehydrogenase YdfG